MSEAHADTDLLAAEYVMGLLGSQETAAFEARIAADAGVRAAVRAARERFLELDLTADAAPLRPALWDAVAGRLAHPTIEDARTGPVHPVSGRFRPVASRGFWSGAGAASLAAGLAAVAVVSLWPKTPGPQPAVIVVLLDAQAKPGAIIEAFADDKVRVVPLENFVVPEGRVIQVWTLPDAATGPVSLGLLPKVHEATLDGPALPKPKPDQLYEFTLEPAGGSPTGRPTGPILAKGLARQPV